MCRKKGRMMNKEYIIEVENADVDTLDTITEALNTFNVRCYVYEKDQCVACNRDVVFENTKGEELTEWEVDDKGDRYCHKCYQDKYGEDL
jgi:hypothetical protein